MMLYSNENKGNLPPDLGTILKTQDLTIDVFVCPSSQDTIPASIKTAPIDEQAKWVNANSSYIYVGAGLKNDTPADTVILYEKSDNHEEDGQNLLYGDGHVEWHPMPVAQELIKNAGKK
jgi:prepilin-type processing-associated H-X9-DG protein